MLQPRPILQEQPQQQNAAVVVTLLVKHLPDALSKEMLLRLFSHYGACDVRPCVAGRLKNCAFVDFQDEVQASRAQSQLHRLQFLGKILIVERATPCPPRKAVWESKDVAIKVDGQPPPLPSYSPLAGQQSVPSTTTHYQFPPTFGQKVEPIAPNLGVDYPFPPHLEYAYPPPDGNILTNIVNALIAVPRFYTQVLHLMNKMNLPAPFRPALPTPPIPPPPPEPTPPKPQEHDLSSDESELESSEEGDEIIDIAANGEMSICANKASKKRKRSFSKDTLGATPTSLVPKEKPIVKKRQPLLQIKISSSKGERLKQPGTEEQEGDNKCQSDQNKKDILDTSAKEGTELKSSATKEELTACRMPPNEMHVLPMFKNYTRGIPTPVLYVKNLAKDVTSDDLYYVFGVVLSKSDDHRSQLVVKLMQEGRMRGQAFVTFPSTDLAAAALDIAHGFILKGKPMIIQFGRNPSGRKIDAGGAAPESQ